MRLAAYILSVVSWTGCGPVCASEPVIGGPCEGCELVFVDQPADIPSHVRIAPATEPGEPLVLEGTVRTAAGDPEAGIVVYAYHTNAAGVYPKASTAHGKLRAWARTDRNGNYRFDTLRPGAYPAGTIPQHIHLHIIDPGRATYFIDDDLLLTETVDGKCALAAVGRVRHIRPRMPTDDGGHAAILFLEKKFLAPTGSPRGANL